MTNLENCLDKINEMTEFHYDEIEEIAEEFNCTLSYSDNKIDDGCEDYEDDDYVMCCSFDVTDNDTNESVWVRIYYGDITLEIGCIDLQ